MAQGRLSVTVSCCDAERLQQHWLVTGGVVEVGVHGRSTVAAAAWTAWLTGCRCMEISAASTAGFD